MFNKFLSYAAASLVLASCSSTDVLEENIAAGTAISFSSHVTNSSRAVTSENLARVRRDYLRFWLAFLFVANQLIIGFGILLGLGRFGGIFAFSTQFVRFSC